MQHLVEECPSCLGSGQVMEGRKHKKGFEYNICNLCNGHGVVHPDIAEDYVFQQTGEMDFNEDND